MRKILLVFITLWLIVPAIYAQKVGLVLSGGGAKGLTHIGIIRALEENNIPIDYIAGTSMGAIIGSLYITLRTDSGNSSYGVFRSKSYSSDNAFKIA